MPMFQFAYATGTSDYKFGHQSIPKVEITDAPADTNFSRSAMLHDSSKYRLYFFKGSTKDTIYQFVWNGSSYEWGYGGAVKEVKITGIPEDADCSKFAMLHDGSDYRLYMRKLGAASIYQFVWTGSSYEFGARGAIKEMQIIGFPDDADLFRWEMLFDGRDYRFYCIPCGSNGILYQGAFNGSGYQYGHKSIPKLNVVGAPEGCDFRDFDMLYDGGNYRLYFKSI